MTAFDSRILIALISFLCTSSALLPNWNKVGRNTNNIKSKPDLVDKPTLIDESYNLFGGTVALGLAMSLVGAQYNSIVGVLSEDIGVIIVILSIWFGYQTYTYRFLFRDNKFSLVSNDGYSVDKNIIVGGDSSWAYSSIVNWALLPNDEFPILLYFRENQTPVDKRAAVPIEIDKLDGQVHFLSSIANVNQLKQNFESRGIPRLK